MEALELSEDDLSALDFNSIQTLAGVDATENPNNEPLHCEPPHTIANALGLKEYDGQDITQNTPTMDLGVPTLS